MKIINAEMVSDLLVATVSSVISVLVAFLLPKFFNAKGEKKVKNGKKTMAFDYFTAIEYSSLSGIEKVLWWIPKFDKYVRGFWIYAVFMTIVMAVMKKLVGAESAPPSFANILMWPSIILNVIYSYWSIVADDYFRKKAEKSKSYLQAHRE